jgi:LL-diaminopimelate aminotransferase|tara:strand:+ start:1539 stop:2693 length:1155 start_codon:yes stop_codon:yes gene_type:complete
MKLSSRVKKLPPYLFADLDKRIKSKREEGADIIHFGIGDPDLPTPDHIIDACCKAAKDPENHRYPSYQGMLSFREAVTERYKRDRKVELDPEREIITLIGSKEGIHNVNFSLIDKGDVVLNPDPCYPVYYTGTIIAGGEPFPMPLKEENSYLPDLEGIPGDKVKKAKLMWINYPNNPTSSIAKKSFFKEAIDFAFDNDLAICSDEAYSKIVLDKTKITSLLEVKGGREVGIVFDSLSKTYNMTGWRIGYALGNEDLIQSLGKIKTNVDSGVSQIIQEAGVTALTSSQDCIRENLRIYRSRLDVLVNGLNRLGFICNKPKATFYVWMKVPNDDSMKFANMLLDKGAIVCTPGIGFGEHGEGYVRFALTQPISKINDALKRLESIL